MLLYCIEIDLVQVRTILHIPIPKMDCWSSNDNNPAGSEYIIIEEAVGKQLTSEWDNLSANAKLAIMRELITIEVKLLSVSFSQ